MNTAVGKYPIVQLMLALVLLCICIRVPAQTIVESVSFPSALAEPTALQKRLASEQNRPVHQNSATLLTATLYRPESSGRHPALVLLHGCRGPQTYQQQWARKFVEWGYVALLVDSFSARGITSTCTDLIEGLNDSSHGMRVYDAFGGFEYLTHHPSVDKTRIGVIGWTYSATLGVSIKQGVQQFFSHRFKAVVAVSPECSYTSSGKFVAPVLVLTGANDTWRPASVCKRMRDNSQELRFPVVLRVYPGAQYGFDDTVLSEPLQLSGVRMLYDNDGGDAILRYNPQAHQQAEADVRAFLDSKI